MNSANISTAASFVGQVTGTSSSPALTCKIGVRKSSTYTGVGTAPITQILDKASSTFTIAASSTLAIDLTTGQTNPLNESISSALAFAKVRYILLEHDPASLSTSIVAFGSGSNQFQGSLSAAATVTLKPGERFISESTTANGLTVDATHKTIQIVNSSGTQSATVSLLIAGSV